MRTHIENRRCNEAGDEAADDERFEIFGECYWNLEYVEKRQARCEDGLPAVIFGQGREHDRPQGETDEVHGLGNSGDELRCFKLPGDVCICRGPGSSQACYPDDLKEWRKRQSNRIECDKLWTVKGGWSQKNQLQTDLDGNDENDHPFLPKGKVERALWIVALPGVDVSERPSGHTLTFFLTSPGARARLP